MTAFGGTTCLIDFCIQPPGQSFAEAFTWRRTAAVIRSGLASSPS